MEWHFIMCPNLDKYVFVEAISYEDALHARKLINWDAMTVKWGYIPGNLGAMLRASDGIVSTVN